MVVIEEEGRKMAEAAAIEARVRCGSRKQWRLGNDSKQVEMKAVVALLLYGLRVAYEDLGVGMRQLLRGLKVAYKDLDPDSEGRNMRWQGWEGRKGDGRGDWGITIGTPRIAALIQIDRTPKVSIDALIPIDRTP
ncbi:hypothetical protein BHE74_00009524 [Ensete ventricosum]|nr:hypothetical protein BHE74_00009524 [Ensete ventricosum]